MINKRLFYPLLIGLLLLAFLPLAGRAAEGNNNVNVIGDPGSAAAEASNSSDAIAVRILPNPNHYSAARWYKSQKFSGSPQALMVDGYDAVRDGRTVYVNAANVNLATKQIYTNIYLISYNQDPDFKTVDVLGQIVDHWRFNSNLNESGNCYISTMPCESDSDCTEGYTCFGKSNAPGRCRLAENDVCYTDADCGKNLYCNSLRAQVARDVRRLGMLGDLRESLAAFNNKNDRYPILGAGTYLPLNSLSVWPSWQSLFLPQIGAGSSLVDPINTLGPCADHDVDTCWNKDTNSFADPEPDNNSLELPAGSYVFTYSSDQNGSNYSLCAAMETKSLGYNTTEGQLADSGCVASGAGYVGSSDNLEPILIATNLQGEQNQEFNGFIKVIDPEGNPLDWSINTSASTWTNWRNNNQNNVAPILQDSSNPNQKRIYAQAAGNAGNYNLPLTVSDGQGGTLSTVTVLKITNSAPLIQSDDLVYYPNEPIPLIVRFSVTDKHHPLSYTFTKATWSSGPYDILSPPHSTLGPVAAERVGDTVYYARKYDIHTTNKFSKDTTFVYVVTAKDQYNVSSTRQINITFKADPPALDLNCSKSVRVGSYYYCGLGWQKQGDHTISYSASLPLPAGLAILETTTGVPELGDDTNISKSSGGVWGRLLTWFKSSLNPAAEAAVTMSHYYALYGTPTVASSSFLIKIKAENEFGAFTEREFRLGVNNYCGDHSLQRPNFEGRGGFYNDGHEDCDGNTGIVVNRNNIPASSPSLQYGCTTKITDTVPFPIMNNQYFCTFLAPDDEEGGGYCGDGICQAKVRRNGQLVPWEIGGLCPEDCTCAGQNQVNNNGECACVSGWYDCDGQDGCESSTDCNQDGGCLASQYLCAGECHPRDINHSTDCGENTDKCCTGGPDCAAQGCPNGFYNCDGFYDCEATSCLCPAGHIWNDDAWPNGGCVLDPQVPCPGQQPCGNHCYNPTTQQCCGGQVVCGNNQYCCNPSANSFVCVSSYTYCYIDSEGGNGNGNGNAN